MKKLITSIILGLSTLLVTAEEASVIIRLDSISTVDHMNDNADTVDEKNVFIWNGQNQIIENYYLENSDTVSKAKYSYESGQLTYSVEEVFEDDEWINDSKQRYTYNSAGINDYVYEAEYNDQSIWEENNYTAYTFTQAGYVASEINYVRDDSDWEETEKFEYAYSASGTKLSAIEYHFQNGEWVPNDKYEYQVDANGFVTEGFNSDFNSTLDVWNESAKYTYEYDAQGNLIKEIGYFFTDEDGNWVLSFELVWTYDYSRQNLVFPFFDIDIEQPKFPEFIHSRVVSSHFTEYNQGVVDHEYSEYFHYSDDTVETNEKPKTVAEPVTHEDPATTIQYNQAIEFFINDGVLIYESIESVKMAVIDMSGNTCVSKKGSGTLTIDLNNLSQGIYNICIYTEEVIQTASIFVD